MYIIKESQNYELDGCKDLAKDYKFFRIYECSKINKKTVSCQSTSSTWNGVGSAPVLKKLSGNSAVEIETNYILFGATSTGATSGDFP